MKKTFLFFCLANILPFANAVEISVGSTRFSIPVPPGCAPITSDMEPYATYSKRFVPASNEQFALFLPTAEVALAANGQLPAGDRRCYVQTAKDLIEPFISTHDFTEFKGVIKTQNEAILKKAEAMLPGMLKEMSGSISNDYRTAFDLSMTQMLPLPPHYDTERGLAYSMILKYNVTGADGKPSVFEGVVTATFVHLRGKVLFLYVNAEKSGLEWSRMESRQWADMVIAANPSVGTVAEREASEGQFHFNWGKLFEDTIMGAVIGGIIGLLGYVFKKKKRQPST